MKSVLFATALGALTLGTAATAEPVAYALDASHSQIVFDYNHLGFSTTYNMFSGFDGQIMFDKDDPAASSVTVEFPVNTMFTGWEARFNHFMSEGLLNGTDGNMVTFASTGIEVTGEDTALITGDLSLNGVTKSVVLDTKLNSMVDAHPRSKKPWIGFDATTTILRSDFGAGMAVPFISDEMNVRISIEAGAE